MADVCAATRCDRDVYHRGWCSKHYSRWRTHGSPEEKVRPYATGFVRLDAGPLVTAIRRCGRPVSAALPAHRDRKAYHRAVNTGRVNDEVAERLLAAIGRTLDDTYGPTWDEVAS